MSATDYGTAVFNKLYALLDGYSGYTLLVLPGNELKTPAQRLQKVSRGAAADNPQVLLDLASSMEDLYPPSEDYSYNATADPSTLAWKENWTYTFLLTVTHASTDLATAGALCAQITMALRKGGPQLGLAYVRRWGPLERHDTVGGTDPAAKGTYTRVSRIMIPVKFEFDGQTLLS
jgi:hypothetical protein